MRKSIIAIVTLFILTLQTRNQRRWRVLQPKSPSF